MKNTSDHSEQNQTFSVLSGKPVFEKDGDYVRVCMNGTWFDAKTFFGVMFRMARTGTTNHKESTAYALALLIAASIRLCEGETMAEKMNAFIEEVEEDFSRALNN